MGRDGTGRGENSTHAHTRTSKYDVLNVFTHDSIQVFPTKSGTLVSRVEEHSGRASRQSD